MREAAEEAQVLVHSVTLPEPADLIASRTADITATQAARTARAAAEAAGTARRAHAAETPTGWRRLVGWASGTSARHRATGANLAATEAEQVRAAEAAETRARQAATALHRARERHEAAVLACREGYRAEAVAAPALIAAVEAGLDLLYQRPELSRMGPAGLLRAGYDITTARNRASLDHEVEADVTRGWGQ